jgi:hypothetical protein
MERRTALGADMICFEDDGARLHEFLEETSFAKRLAMEWQPGYLPEQIAFNPPHLNQLDSKEVAIVAKRPWQKMIWCRQEANEEMAEWIGREEDDQRTEVAAFSDQPEPARQSAMLNETAKQRSPGMWRNRFHFEQSLKRRGFRQIGDGMFAAVYAKPGSNKVIKIAGDKDSWPIYIAWASKNGYLGTFAPNVTSFRVFDTGYDTFYVAVMERLSMTLRQIEESGQNHPALDKRRDMMKYGHFRSMAEIKKNVPEWAEFIEGLLDCGNESGVHFDVHRGNWMVIDDRLVLTDPFSGGSNTSAATLDAATTFRARKSSMRIAA